MSEERDDLYDDEDLEDCWFCCLPAVCPIHGQTLAIPANCSTTAWHCLLCVLAAAGTEMDAILFAAGCHPFASPHLLDVDLMPANGTDVEQSVNGQTSLPPTVSIERGA